MGGGRALGRRHSRRLLRCLELQQRLPPLVSNLLSPRRLVGVWEDLAQPLHRLQAASAVSVRHRPLPQRSGSRLPPLLSEVAPLAEGARSGLLRPRRQLPSAPPLLQRQAGLLASGSSLPQHPRLGVPAPSVNPLLDSGLQHQQQRCAPFQQPLPVNTTPQNPNFPRPMDNCSRLVMVGVRRQQFGGGGAFGAAAPTGFGAAAPTGFGAPAAAPGFGAAAAVPQSGAPNTSIGAFQPSKGPDGTGPNTSQQATYMCITHMEAYKNYSFEELRVGDYAMNRKKKEAGGGGMFGAAAQVHPDTSSQPHTPSSTADPNPQPPAAGSRRDVRQRLRIRGGSRASRHESLRRAGCRACLRPGAPHPLCPHPSCGIFVPGRRGSPPRAAQPGESGLACLDRCNLTGGGAPRRSSQTLFRKAPIRF